MTYLVNFLFPLIMTSGKCNYGIEYSYHIFDTMSAVGYIKIRIAYIRFVVFTAVTEMNSAIWDIKT
jgi:hypothetical protein